MSKPFEPGWEIGVQSVENGGIEVRTVARIGLYGSIVLDDDTEWQNTGLAWPAEDEDEKPYPRLVPIAKAWRKHRRAYAISRLLKDVFWSEVEDDTLLSIYAQLERDGFFESWQLDKMLAELNARERARV